MGDARYAFSLLRGGRGHQSAGGYKQNILQFAAFHGVQNVPAEYTGRAAASGTAGVHILAFPVVDQKSAVVMVPHFHVILPQKIMQECRAHRAQIAGENMVVIGRLCRRIREVVQKGLCGGRGHGSAHIGDVGNAEILDAADRGVLDPNTCAASQNRTAGRRSGPLRGGAALAAVFQRRAELTLRRAEMGGSHGAGVIGAAMASVCAIVEQAPYCPRKGMSMSRRPNVLEMH